MKVLEIGVGRTGKTNPTWDGLDIVAGRHTDIVADIENPLPIKSNCYDLIYMSHVLEHVPWFKAVEVLIELRRVIVPGGSIEIWVPDLGKLVAAYLNPELIQKDGWYKFNPEKDPTKWFNSRLFTYGPGPENWHRSAFDERWLKKCLTDAYFRDLQKLTKPRGCDHGWINLGVRGVK